jgi:hypothetical protein
MPHVPQERRALISREQGELIADLVQAIIDQATGFPLSFTMFIENGTADEWMVISAPLGAANMRSTMQQDLYH